MDENAHVLVVDDHRDIRDPLAAYLKKHGFRVSRAAERIGASRLVGWLGDRTSLRESPTAAMSS